MHNGDFKHFSLEYIRYPIGLAVQVFRSDLNKVESAKEFRMVLARWRLAEKKFLTDRRNVMLHGGVVVGAISKAEEYMHYLTSARHHLTAKERELTVKQ